MLASLPLAETGLVDFNPASALLVLIIFLFVAIVLYKSAWKHVLSGLKARENRIRTDIADAEAARLKAQKTLAEYNAQLASGEQKVRDLLNQAAADAEKIAAGIRTKAQQDAQEAKEGANREIEAAKQAALSEIYVQTANLATSVAEKIIRKSLNADDQRELVSQSVEQFKESQRKGAGQN